MQRQGSFAEAEYAGKKKQTRRDKFLAEMEQAVPWPRLVARLAPLYPKGERGRPPIPLERILRVYFVQQWYGLADEAVEDAFYDSQALRGFAGIVLNRDPIPDATTVLHFRHWLERHDLTRGLFEEVTAMLEERGLLMRQGTIVDATIIAAPSSTKNKQQSRDPEMHQTKKGNQLMEWMPPPDGIAMCQGGDVFASHERRGHPWKRLASSVSTLQSGPFRRMAPSPMEAWLSARSFRERKSSPSLPSSRAASSPWRPAGARITGVGRSVTSGTRFA